MVGTGGSPACPGECTEAGLSNLEQWGSCCGGKGPPWPTGNMVSRTDTYRGQTNFTARFPSGMKLMMAMDDFIPFFIFSKTEQLEAMAVTYHTPANCNRTLPVEFGKLWGPARRTCTPPWGTWQPGAEICQPEWTCHCLWGPVSLFRNLPPSVGICLPLWGT